MTGTEPLDRAAEARPMSRPALLAAVVAVCGTGLLAGLGLFGGSTPRPHAAPAAAVVVQAAETPGPRADRPVHARKHRLHAHHSAARVAHPAHLGHINTPRINATHINATNAHAAHTLRDSSLRHEMARHAHKGSAGRRSTQRRPALPASGGAQAA